MIQKITIAVALGTMMLGMPPASAADFRVPPGPQYGAPPQEVYPPQVQYGYVPAPPPVYAPRAVVVAPAPYYYDEPYYAPRPYLYPRYAYPRYGAYPRDDWRVGRPYAGARYTHYRNWGPGYRRW